MLYICGKLFNMYVNILIYNALDHTTKSDSHQLSGSSEDIIQLTIGNNRYTFNGDGGLINSDKTLGSCGVQNKNICAVYGNNPTYTLNGETKPLFNSNNED